MILLFVTAEPVILIIGLLLAVVRGLTSPIFTPLRYPVDRLCRRRPWHSDHPAHLDVRLRYAGPQPAGPA